MKLSPDPVEKPLRKLRKVLKRFPEHPSPDQVHSLRTQTRRLEAVLAALMLEETAEARRLLKLVTPLRKGAGEVRDMDVLIGDLLTLPEETHETASQTASLVRLIETLAQKRQKRVRKLNRVIARNGSEARKSLKRCARLIESRVTEDSSAALHAGPQILKTELRHWPTLDESNLHPFRIKVKAWGYMLQLSRNADHRLFESLTEAKDAIGDWHDWMALRTIAAKVLDPEEDRDTLCWIESVQTRKLQAAFSAANALRRQHLNAGPAGPTHSLRRRPASQGSTIQLHRPAGSEARATRIQTDGH